MNKMIYRALIENKIYILRVSYGECGECIFYSYCNIEDKISPCNALRKRMNNPNIVFNRWYIYSLFVVSYFKYSYHG